MNVVEWSDTELRQRPYAVIGSGGFTHQLQSVASQRQCQQPVVVLDAQAPTMTPDVPDALVLGTDTFQLEIMARWTPYLRPNQYFVDVSDWVLAGKDQIERAAKTPEEPADVLLCGIGTAIAEHHWLHVVRTALVKKGIRWRSIHPLASDRAKWVSQAKAVIVWNGSTAIFHDFLALCSASAVPVTYAECGFFPQSAHFYFDRDGVNLASQLCTESFDWLSADDFARVSQYRNELFGARESTDCGYIFIPLQIASDSNIQLNSGFTHGMQAYIDFIHSQYPANKLVYKVHPKDQYGHNYQFYGAEVSRANTLDLIAGASLVRGINSSVLFEAALFGKPVQADGRCLLNQCAGSTDQIIAAMLARQYRVTDFAIRQQNIMKFSRLGHLFYG